MADEFTTDTEDWTIAEEGVYVGNPEFIYVKADKDDKILWAIKTDGTIYWGAGCPQQVKDYIEEKIAELPFDEYEDIVAFLNGLEKGDKTLQQLFNEKVDKEEGKSLINAEYASCISIIESSEYMQAVLDSEDKVLEATDDKGKKHLPYPTNQDDILDEKIDNLREYVDDAIDNIEQKIVMFAQNIGSGGVIENNVDTRALSNILKYSHKVHVGLRKTAINKDIGETRDRGIKFCIYCYNETEDVITRSVGYVRHDVDVPANTPFRILAKYDQIDGVDFTSAAPIRENPDEFFIISEEPTYLVLPPYWNNNGYLDNKIKLIRDKYEACASNADMFILISDVHWEMNEQHSPAIIKYLSESLPIKRMFNCGDDADGLGYNVFMPFYNAFRGDYYWVIGNHDVQAKYLDNGTMRYEMSYNIVGSWENQRSGTTDAIHATHHNMMKDAVFGSISQGYYYVDNPELKLRYIILSATPNAHSGFTGLTTSDTTQIDWLNATIGSMEESWYAVIFSHFIIHEDLAHDDAVYILDSSTENIRNAINANHERIIAVFVGDAHIDRVWVMPNGTPMICTTTDKLTGNQKTPRDEGTITEQAFDVVIIDKSSKKIDMIRIGALARDGYGLGNTDEEWGPLVEERIINY